MASTFFMETRAQCPAGFVVDGNPCDWSNAPAGARIGDPFGTGVLDDQFTQGSKDFFLAEDLRWAIGQTKEKNDIANAAAFLDGCILRFAGDRSSNNGDAQIGFWFYINGTGPVTQPNGTQNFAPEHYYDPVTGIGDLLIIANFTNGGELATVTIYKWVGTGGNVPNTGGALNTTNLVGTAAQNNDTEYPIPDGWVFGSATYETNEFYEGAVNLCDYLQGNPICISTFLLEARSSQEVTASLDDFVGGPFVSKPTPPTVTPGARCGPGTVSLSASCSTAGSTVRWWADSTGGSPIFTGSPFTTPSLTQTDTFYVSCFNATTQCESARVPVIATVNANPLANAGPDQAKCQTPPSGPTSFTLAGTGSNGTFAWTQIASTGTASASIVSPTSLTSTVNVSGIGTVTLRLTTTSNTTPPCGTATDDVILTVNANPVANAGPDEAKCQTPPSGPTSFTLAGTGSGGTFAWTQIASTGTASASIVSPTSLTSTVNVSGIGTVTLRLTTTSAACGTATDDVILTVNANPTANAGTDQTKCQTPPSGPTSFTLAGTAANGTTAWTQISSTGTANASIANPASLTSTVSVSGVGSVTLRLTTTSANCGTATDDVILTVTLNPTANAGLDQAKCQTPPSGPTSFTMAGIGTSGTVSWQQIASTGTASSIIADPASLTTNVSVSGIGTVTLRLTVTSTSVPSCGTATDDVILTVLPNPTAAAGPDEAKCQTPPAGPTSFTLAGTASNGTTAWTQIASTGTANATIANPTSLTSTVSVTGIGTVTLRLTTTSNTSPSCGTATDDVILTVNANPDVQLGPLEVCASACLDLISPFPGTFSGQFVTFDVLRSVFQFCAPALPGPYPITFTATNQAGCILESPIEVNVVLCISEYHCTLTQGAYGNAGGNDCDGVNGSFPTPVLINNLLGATGITVGRPGQSVIIPPGSANALIAILPGGGPAKALAPGNCNITAQGSPSCLPLKNGRINNVLLSQTIALSLNVRMNAGSLANFVLVQDKYLVTQARDGCGDTATTVSCAEDSSAIKSWSLDQSVIDYLTAAGGYPPTVAGLLDLANDVLGGVLVPGVGGVPSFSAVASVVDAINNAFDHCRTFVGWFDCAKNCANLALPCETILTKLVLPTKPTLLGQVNSLSVEQMKVDKAGTTKNGIVTELNVTAFPNPFTDRVRFVIASPITGPASLEIFNHLGQQINVAFKGHVVAGYNQTIDYKIPGSITNSLFYKLRIGEKMVTGRLVRLE